MTRIIALTTVLLLGAAQPAKAMLEDHFLYFPAASLVASPADAGLDYQEVFFEATDGIRLHGWYLPGNPDRPALLYCHGNAGNISHRLDALFGLHRLGLNVLIFDYRGYGHSSGQPSEAGTYQDAAGALAWLRSQGWPANRTIYFGRSLGAAVALQLALEHPPAALVMETPFTSIAAMGKRHYPVLSRALGWLLDLDYDNARKIPDLQSRLLITQGRADRIVPPVMAQELFALAPEPKRLLLLEGLGHNDSFFRHESYQQAWEQLVSVLLQEGE